MKVMLNDLMKKHNIDIVFYDIEQNYEQAVRYGITTVPTLIKVDFNFDELERIEGARPKYELEKFIKELV